eukprot:gene25698-31033_t
MKRCPLSKAQKKAITHVSSLLLQSGSPSFSCSQEISLDPRSLRVTLNFHPDRLLPNGRLVLEAMIEDDIYTSQFITGTSNGGLSAFPGGKRWDWESRIFGQSYDDAPDCERPVYGALNYLNKPVGGAPRFGSAHFRLRAHVLSRTTFCYPDSYYEPTDFALWGSAVYDRDNSDDDLESSDDCRLSDSCKQLIAKALDDYSTGSTRDPLDDYIEAHVHGAVLISRDVEALVLDPCFRGTYVEEIAKRLPCAVEWHAGYALSIDMIRKYPSYRGQSYVELACALSRNGMIDPVIVGEAVKSLDYDPQDVKKVWHYVACFGYSQRCEKS